MSSTAIQSEGVLALSVARKHRFGFSQDVLVKLDRCTEAIALHKQSCALLDELIGPKQLKTVVGKEHLAQVSCS